MEARAISAEPLDSFIPEEPSRHTESVAMSAHEGIAAALPQSPLKLEAGSAIKHYEIIRELGHGGMGRVFLARDMKLARLCAIKLMLGYSGAHAERFLAEARATARCKHENIVVVYEVDETRQTPYMVLEYLEGRTLKTWMAERAAPVSAASAVEIVVPVVRALAASHDMGIVHLDLKPENIMLTERGQVKVLDFGVAQQIVPGETQQGALGGTRLYMSPEQWLRSGIDRQSDIWAVGVLLYELFVGSHPLAPVTLAKLDQVKDLDKPMPLVRECRQDAGALGLLVDRCLAKLKSARIGSADELLAALEAITNGSRQGELSGETEPFAGLSAFQEADAGRFFGRERDTATVVGRLRNQPIVVVAGPSGAGKSSFVRAGVIAALKRSEGHWESFIVRPGRKPLAALAEILTQVEPSVANTNEGDATENIEMVDALREKPGALGARLRARCRNEGRKHRILVFVDQFEELYTLGTDPAERAAFLSCLLGVADDASSPLRVVLAIRSDFLDRMAQDGPFMDAGTPGLFFLSPMTHDDLRAALVRPLETTGYDFENPDMVSAMLNALATTPLPLPILQFTAAKLWEQRDNERRLLTRESYERIGGVEGALATYADSVMAAMTDREQQLARAVFLRLVTPERTRAVVGLSDLRELDNDGVAVESIVSRLSDMRLLSIETADGGAATTVELVHESLIERWPRLRRWLEANLEEVEFLGRVSPAAKQWQASGSPEGLLWRGQAAEDAQQWQRRHGNAEGTNLGLREMRFIAAVVALDVRERRRKRGVLAAVIGGLGIAVVAVSAFAFQAKREATNAAKQSTRAEAQTALAEAEKAEAERSAVRARNATRMATARGQQDDPTIVFALLREIEPGPLPQGWPELARMAFDTGIAMVVLPHSARVYSAAWSPDGRRVVTVATNTIRIWNADGTGESRSLQGHTSDIYRVAWSRDGAIIASASGDKTVRIWSVDGTEKPVVLRGHEGVVFGVAISPDGRRIASGSADNTVRIWNADGTGEPLVLHGHEDQIRSVSFSPDGKHVVSGSFDTTVRVWKTDGTSEPLVLRGHQGRLMSVSYSPDGQFIASGAGDTKVRVWNADGAGDATVLAGHDGWVHSVAWSPDGKRIVSASEDRTVRVWNADGTGETRILHGHDDAVEVAAFSADGSRILSASSDKSVRIWENDAAGQAKRIAGPSAKITQAVFSPDGRRIVASNDSTGLVYQADGTGEPLVLGRPEDGVHTAVFSPDGSRIATAGMNRKLRIYDVNGTHQPILLRGHTDYVNQVVFSPDSRRILSASMDKTIRVWNVDGTGEPIVLPHRSDVFSAAFSPDGRRIASAAGNTAWVWNADGTSEPLALKGHTGVLGGAAWTPDGLRIVSGAEAVRIWNADGTGEPLVLRGHEGMVFVSTIRAVSPDGRRIVSSSHDGTVRVWNADGQGEPLIIRLSTSAVVSASWSPDGRSLIAAAIDKGIWIWSDIEPFPEPENPKLWRMTNYCLPLDLRKRLLDFSEEQLRKDLERCERRVRETGSFSQ